MPTVSKKATELTYTPAELEAIEALKANRGVRLSAKELGVKVIILTSLVKKGMDERPMAPGVERVIVNKEDFHSVCPTCGAQSDYKVYWID